MRKNWALRLLLGLPLLAAAPAPAADTPQTVRAVLQAAENRKAAPDFALHDASGKTVKLSKYRGKVVLLDFWATWCHGCKEEIPWFVEFRKRYGPRGFAVIGVSLDEGGWKVVNPFIRDKKIPYTMLLGSDSVALIYGAHEMLPDSS